MSKKKEKDLEKQLSDIYEAKMKYLLESSEYKMQKYKTEKRMKTKPSKSFPVQ